MLKMKVGQMTCLEHMAVIVNRDVRYEFVDFRGSNKFKDINRLYIETH